MKSPPNCQSTGQSGRAKELEEQAALYALGLLHGIERSNFEDVLGQDSGEVARLALREFESALGKVSALLPKLRVESSGKSLPKPDPPAALPGTLDGLIAVTRAKFRWGSTHPEGALFTILRHEPGGDIVSGIARFPAGSRWESGARQAADELVILSGDLECRGRHYGPSDYLYLPPEVTLGTLATQGGVHLFVRGPMSSPFFGNPSRPG